MLENILISFDFPCVKRAGSITQRSKSRVTLKTGFTYEIIVSADEMMAHASL